MGLVSEGDAEAATAAAQAVGRRLFQVVRHSYRRLSSSVGKAPNATVGNGTDDNSDDNSDEGSAPSHAPFPHEMTKLLDQLTMFSITFCVLLTIQIGGLQLWKHKINRKYYAALRGKAAREEAEIAKAVQAIDPLAIARPPPPADANASHMGAASLAQSGGTSTLLLPSSARRALRKPGSVRWAPSFMQHPWRRSGRVAPSRSLQHEATIGRATNEEHRHVEEDETQLPPFIPLPGLLVFPNILLLCFWLFNTGLVKNATALLCWQLQSPEGRLLSATVVEDHAGTGEVDTDDRRVLAGRWLAAGAATTLIEPQCGRGCTILAVTVLACIALVLATSLAIILNFWYRFHTVCWTRTKPAEKPKEVGDPLFRLWSQLKVVMSRLWSKQPPKPSPEEIHAAFVSYDKDGRGASSFTLSAHGLAQLAPPWACTAPSPLPHCSLCAGRSRPLSARILSSFPFWSLAPFSTSPPFLPLPLPQALTRASSKSCSSTWVSFPLQSRPRHHTPPMSTTPLWLQLPWCRARR